MAFSGYSGAPLTKKLGIKPESRCRLWNAPQTFELSDGISADDGVFDVAIAFCLTEADLLRALAELEPILETNGGLWLAWPKKASGVPTECSDSLVRNSGLACGLVDNKVCAIDETWSALRFVRRLRDR